MNHIKLRALIRKVEGNKNKQLKDLPLLGINIDKEFMPSVANTIGTDMSNYQIVKKEQFACNPMHLGRDERMPTALLLDKDEILVSPAYFVFEIIDKNVLLPEYLMLYFKQTETDRLLWFKTDSSVRGGLGWNELCDIEIPVPDLNIQKDIIRHYNQISDAIKIKEKLNNNLEQQAENIFRAWFVDFKPFDGTKPDSWREISFSDIADFINGYSYQGDELQKSNYAMATIKNFNRDGGFKLDGFKEIIPSAKLRKAQEVNIFDVLVAHTDLTQNAYVLGNAELLLSKNKYEKIIMSMDLVKVAPKTNEISTFLLAAILKNKKFKTHCLRYKSGTTVLHLSKRALPEYRLIFPNNLEDIKPLEKMLSEIYKTTAKNIEETASLLKLRDALLPKLMLENSDSSSDKLSFI